MTGLIRNSIHKIMSHENLYEKVIGISMTTGTVFGGVIGTLLEDTPTLQDTMKNSFLGGCCDCIGGMAIGFISPILVPIGIITGTIGLASYGINNWNISTNNNKQPYTPNNEHKPPSAQVSYDNETFSKVDVRDLDKYDIYPTKK